MKLIVVWAFFTHTVLGANQNNPM